MHGKLTAALAQKLSQEYGPRGIHVFHDHGEQEPRGEIVSWFGSPRMPERSTRLSELDIAIIHRETDRAMVLIEVEESNDRPRTLLADAFATLLGTQISYRGKRLKIGPWTTLLLIAHGTSDHYGRNAFLLQQTELARLGLSTGNSQIGKVLIETFSDGIDLEQKVRNVIDRASRNPSNPQFDPAPARSVPVLYRVLQRTDTGATAIAEIRDGVFSGDQADYVREELEYWGYPAVPLQEALERLRFANSTFIGFERVDLDDPGGKL